jgi:hypothetical protein
MNTSIPAGCATSACAYPGYSNRHGRHPATAKMPQDDETQTLTNTVSGVIHAAYSLSAAVHSDCSGAFLHRSIRISFNILP